MAGCHASTPALVHAAAARGAGCAPGDQRMRTTAPSRSRRPGPGGVVLIRGGAAFSFLFFSPSLARARWARGFHGAVGTGANSNAPACPGLVVCCAVAGFFSLSFPVASTLLPVLGSPAAPSKLHQHLPPPYPSRREIMRARGISARPTFLQRQRAL